MLIWRLFWFKCSRKGILRTKRQLTTPKWQPKRKKKLLTCKKLDVCGFHFSSGLPCHVLSMLKHTWKGDIVNITDKYYDKIVVLGQNRMLTLHSFFDKLFYSTILRTKFVSCQRINEVGKDLRDHWVQPVMEQHHANQTMALSARFSLSFKHLQGWSVTPPPPMGSPFPSLIILSVARFLLMSNLKLPWCSLKPWEYFERKT